MTSAPLAALIAFASRTPDTTQADVDQVMRALAEHDGWIVPAAFALHTWGTTTFPQTFVFPEAPPAPVLGVFTDPESAELVHTHPGAAPVGGAYVGPVRGVDLLRALQGWTSLSVNPSSPREHQWYIASGGFEIASSWASTIAVERALAALESGPVPGPELLAHRYQILVDRDTGGVAQVNLADIGDVAVCFTAADRGLEFIASLPLDVRPKAELAPVEGRRLFEMVLGMGVAGVVVNAGSDDQAALAREELIEVVAPALT